MKIEMWRIENLKRKKKDLETIMNDLKEEFGKETFKAEEKQGLLAVFKAAAFLRPVKEKKDLKKTWKKKLAKAEEIVEKDLKQMRLLTVKLTYYVIKPLVY